MLITSLFCIIKCPVHLFLEESFIVDPHRTKAYCYLLVCIHILLLTLNFFMEVVPKPRARVWGTFFGLIFVIYQLVIVTELLGLFP
jgi:hypothetical protein